MVDSKNICSDAVDVELYKNIVDHPKGLQENLPGNCQSTYDMAEKMTLSPCMTTQIGIKTEPLCFSQRQESRSVDV
jgi:hypothetical protein